jgi:hypothetical protein
MTEMKNCRRCNFLCIGVLLFNYYVYELYFPHGLSDSCLQFHTNIKYRVIHIVS